MMMTKLVSTSYIVIEVLIAVLSVCGNVLVCWAVATNSNLKTATHYFLVSLAVADILVGCLAIPFAVTVSVGIRLDFHGCLFLACFVLVLTQSSIFSLLAIAVDRYLAIKIPLRYKELMTGKRARVIIASLWILSFVIGLLPFLEWNMKETACPPTLDNGSTGAVNLTGSDETAAAAAVAAVAGKGGVRSGGSGGSRFLRTCELECQFESVVDMQYMVYFNFFVCVLLPLLIMLGIYLKIFTVARQQLRQIELKCVGNGGGDSHHHHHHSLLQREIRAAKSLSIIMGLFAVCWLPVHILNTLKLFHPGLWRPQSLMFVAIVLSHANSAVNPVIYAYRLQDFRDTFRKILERHFLCRREEIYHSSNGNKRNRDPVLRHLPSPPTPSPADSI
ncbi:hypothetical protein CRUP_005711, partial [Coryphaenoides rupestris]